MVRAGGERMSGAGRKGGESEDAGRSDNRAYVRRAFQRRAAGHIRPDYR